MVLIVRPETFLIGRPQVVDLDLREYINAVDGNVWLDRVEREFEIEDGEKLVEFAGRMCYRSFEPGLNPNVTKVRTDSSEYLENILKSYHGSVTEHAFYVFVFHNVSRVFTHELVRHRAGTSISQESLRYVRLTELPFWYPEWSQQDTFLMDRCNHVLRMLEAHQEWMSEYFDLQNESSFHEKKVKTSFMRRFAPEGLATGIVWGANIRTLRHVIEMRTSEGAEEEIRLVFDDVARMMQNEAPSLFGDFERSETGEWTPKYRKV